MPLYFTAEKAGDLEAAPDTYLVEHIVKERVGRDGRREFLTRWQGCGPEADTWEPLASFFPQVNEELLKYCSGKGSTTVDLADLYQEDRRQAAELRQVNAEDWVVIEDQDD